MVVGIVETHHAASVLVAVDNHKTAGFVVCGNYNQCFPVLVCELDGLTYGHIEAQHFDNGARKALGVTCIVDFRTLDEEEESVFRIVLLKFLDSGVGRIGEQGEVFLLGCIAHFLVDADDLAFLIVDLVCVSNEVIAVLFQFGNEVPAVMTDSKLLDAASAEKVKRTVNQLGSKHIRAVTLRVVSIECGRCGIHGVSERNHAHFLAHVMEIFGKRRIRDPVHAH